MRFVVIGLHAAGRSACAWLRRLSPDAEILGVDPRPDPPYARPLISHVLAGEVDPGLLFLKETDFFDRHGVTLCREKATSLDPDRRVVTLASGRELPYDAALIATGSVPRPAGVDGPSAGDIRYFRGRSDLDKVLADVRPGGMAAVLGGGLVGFKLTCGLLARGMNVTLLVTSPRPLSLNVDATAGSLVGNMLACRPGVTLMTNVSVVCMEPGTSRRHRLTLSNGTVHEVDLVAAGKGVIPATDWLTGTGLATAEGVPADAYLQTAAPDVYVAGDAALTTDLSLGEQRLNAIWPMAVEQGRYAAVNMAGGRVAYPGSLSQNAVPVFESMMISVGTVNPRYTAGCDFETVASGPRGYLNLVFRDDRLIGAVGLDAPPRLGELAAAVRRGLKRGDIPANWLRNPAGAAPLAAAGVGVGVGTAARR
jgi:NAD(P)H-nitrite reductase large subunit